MKTSPVHLIKAYVKENAAPDMAKDANKGSPSHFQALIKTAIQAIERMLREYTSVLLRSCILLVS